MSSFTSTPSFTPLDDGRTWRVEVGFEYHIGVYPAWNPQNIIRVPAGFLTDFASVPQALWVLFPPWDKYGKAAVLHDFCYVSAWRTRIEADNVFFEAMGILGVPMWKRLLMWAAVRLAGQGNYPRYGVDQ